MLLISPVNLGYVHCAPDNGWNSELAVKNIENIISKLNIDLFYLVINWEEL
jgi:hypothetical protein